MCAAPRCPHLRRTHVVLIDPFTLSACLSPSTTSPALSPPPSHQPCRRSHSPTCSHCCLFYSAFLTRHISCSRFPISLAANFFGLFYCFFPLSDVSSRPFPTSFPEHVRFFPTLTAFEKCSCGHIMRLSPQDARLLASNC